MPIDLFFIINNSSLQQKILPFFSLTRVCVHVVRFIRLNGMLWVIFDLRKFHFIRNKKMEKKKNESKKQHSVHIYSNHIYV